MAPLSAAKPKTPRDIAHDETHLFTFYQPKTYLTAHSRPNMATTIRPIFGHTDGLGLRLLVSSVW